MLDFMLHVFCDNLLESGLILTSVEAGREVFGGGGRGLTILLLCHLTFSIIKSFFLQRHGISDR